MKRYDSIVGIDLGTSKTCIVIAEIVDEKNFEVIGAGTSDSRGINAGVIVNIDEATDTILDALDKAMEMAGKVRVRDVIVNVSGKYIKSFDTTATVNISRGKGAIITENDVKRVIDAARINASSGGDEEIIHVLPRNFIVDNESGIQNPINMSGSKLEIDALIVTGNPTSLRNLRTAFDNADLYVSDVVVNALASGESTLSIAEREQGTAVIDIGSGTTDIGVFSDGSLIYTRVIPGGSKYVTNDISIGFKIPFEDAERIKINHGNALPEYIDKSSTIKVDIGGIHQKDISVYELSKVIEARAKELLSLAKKGLDKSGYTRYIRNGGVVLTGGFSLLKGVDKLAESVFETSVRVGFPNYTGPLFEMVNTPIHSTIMGLLLYGIKNIDERDRRYNGPLDKILDFIRKIFGDIF
ncbi:MAG TPA: cell division protein FtsA [Candidatus Atribacteria bacterium]|nr:cell division protein FtsA [Candidatus Atribacteria bacterium]